MLLFNFFSIFSDFIILVISITHLYYFKHLTQHELYTELLNQHQHLYHSELNVKPSVLLQMSVKTSAREIIVFHIFKDNNYNFSHCKDAMICCHSTFMYVYEIKCPFFVRTKLFVFQEL